MTALKTRLPEINKPQATISGVLPLALTERWSIMTALKTRLPEINKPQATISGVEISMCYPMDSNTCIEVTA
jgi:hypothetical protein